MPSVPGLEEGASPRLTDEAREAIDAYLEQRERLVLRVLGALGFTTLAGVFLSLGYIFFVLPESAANKAFQSWGTRFSLYETRVVESLAKASELRGRAEANEEVNKKLRQENEDLNEAQKALQESMLELESRRDELKAFLSNISVRDLERATELARSLEGQDVVVAKRRAATAVADARNAMERAEELKSQLEELESALERLLVRTTELEGELQRESPQRSEERPRRP